MKLVRSLSTILLMIILVTGCGSSRYATPGDILASPGDYDNKTVSVSGTVTNLDARMSRAGNAYFTFDLKDGRDDIKVFSFGEPRITEGDGVAIKGLFQCERSVSHRTYYNEIDCSKGSIKKK